MPSAKGDRPTCLTLTFKEREIIRVGGDIQILVTKCSRGKTTLTFWAPPEKKIERVKDDPPK